MRTMYDGVTASNLPTDAEMVGGYVDGLYKWSSADWDRFPHAVKVRIAVDPHHNEGEVLDVERGDARPDQAPAWVEMRRKAGVDPSIYCNSSTWPQVKAAFQRAHVPQPHYWVAHWGSGRSIPVGAVAKQYENTSKYDLSVVADYWPGVDKAPAGSGSAAQSSGGTFRISKSRAENAQHLADEAAKLIGKLKDVLHHIRG